MEDSDTDALFAWLLRAGGALDGWEVRSSEAGGARGGCATRAVKQGQLLLSVPASLLVTAGKAAGDAASRARTHDCAGSVALRSAAHHGLMVLGPSWILPSQHCCPAFLGSHTTLS